MSVAHLHTPVKQLNGFSLYYSDNVAIIVISRGENRLNLEFITTLNSFLDDVERNESCKGLITTGSGKFYCNGLDLEWLTTISQEVGVQFRSELNACIKRLICFPLPTLAAINGHAFAGGAILAFAHDLRTMRIDKGWLCFNEVFIDLHFTPFLLELLRDKIGNGKTLSELLVLGHRFTAAEALNAALIHNMTPANLLVTESFRVLKSYIGKNVYPRGSLSKMKENVYQKSLKVLEEDETKLVLNHSKL